MWKQGKHDTHELDLGFFTASIYWNNGYIARSNNETWHSCYVLLIGQNIWGRYDTLETAKQTATNLLIIKIQEIETQIAAAKKYLYRNEK